MPNSNPSRNAKYLSNAQLCQAFTPKITHSFPRRPFLDYSLAFFPPLPNSPVSIACADCSLFKTVSAYTGTVSGFGQNVHQFIDFTAISSADATFSYTSTSQPPP
jgi:hypothetical protein